LLAPRSEDTATHRKSVREDRLGSQSLRADERDSAP
jgi:hypothetical protein